jgi:hypothetical protein
VARTIARRPWRIYYDFTGNCGLTGLTKSLPNDKFAGTRRLRGEIAI